MYCPNCGKQIDDRAVVCVGCGVPVTPMASQLKSPYDGFYRSGDDKILAGVCGGLAHKFKMPPLAVRILSIFIPFNIILYIVGAIAMPVLPTKNIHI